MLYLQDVVIVPATALTLKGQQEAHTFAGVDGPGTALQVRVQAVTPQVRRSLDVSGYGKFALKHILTTCGGVAGKYQFFFWFYLVHSNPAREGQTHPSVKLTF